MRASGKSYDFRGTGLGRHHTGLQERCSQWENFEKPKKKKKKCPLINAACLIIEWETYFTEGVFKWIRSVIVRRGVNLLKSPSLTQTCDIPLRVLVPIASHVLVSFMAMIFSSSHYAIHGNMRNTCNVM